MSAANFNFESRSGRNHRWLLLRPWRTAIEIKWLRENAFAVRRFSHGLFAADEFANLCCSCRTVVGQFAIAQPDAAVCAGN